MLRPARGGRATGDERRFPRIRTSPLIGARRTTRRSTWSRTRRGRRQLAVILPVHGYGLWSTLYGYLAVKPTAARSSACSSTSTPRRRASAARSTTRMARPMAGQAAVRRGRRRCWHRGGQGRGSTGPEGASSGRRPGRRHADLPRGQQSRALLGRRERLRSVPEEPATGAGGTQWLIPSESW